MAKASIVSYSVIPTCPHNDPLVTKSINVVTIRLGELIKKGSTNCRCATSSQIPIIAISNSILKN